MNYNRPPAAPAGLTYPILQETINLSNADFTKLNTSPLQLLPNQSNNICPLNIIIQYTNSGIGLSSVLLIGFESLLGPSSGGNNICFWNASFITFQTGVFTFSTPYGAGDYANTTDFEPLILWSQIDNSGLTFTRFYATITYIRIPNL